MPQKTAASLAVCLNVSCEFFLAEAVPILMYIHLYSSLSGLAGFASSLFMMCLGSRVTRNMQ